MKHTRWIFGGLVGATVTAAAAHADDWPQWGRDATNNMVSNETGLPDDFAPGEFIGASDDLDLSTAKNVKWVAKLGSQTYGNPVVSDGRILIGTNNDAPRNPALKGDRSNVYCFNESDGAYQWQLSVPKLGAGKVSDWEFLGICSSPAVEGDRAWVVTNQCEVLCIDLKGMGDGNDGFADEGQYLAGRGKPAIEVAPGEADILWSFNMTDECGVFPHNVTSSSVVVMGDQVWASTSNGVDYGHVDMPSPRAPCLVVIDKNTGELLAEEQIGLGARTFHCNWSSPGYIKTDDLDMAVFGGPDGRCYAFSPEFVQDEDDFTVLQELWRFDVNLPTYREKDGKPVKYATRKGPSEIISSPVFYDGHVYTAIGQDPEHGEGVGRLVCIDPTKRGDITDSGKVWEFNDIHRTISTPSIADGLVYIADYSGFVYCLDAKTGELYWRYDTKGHIWGSTLAADGKVYIGNEDGYLTILAAGKEMKLIKEIDMLAPVYSSPIAANGVLYIGTQTHLFALTAQPAK